VKVVTACRLMVEASRISETSAFCIREVHSKTTSKSRSTIEFGH
jgi:hypothetical protein